MAEASLLSQKVSMKEASNFEALVACQHEELSLWEDKEKLEYEE
jgi:hypothetical protein